MTVIEKHLFRLRRHNRLLAAAFRSKHDSMSVEFSSRLRVNECGSCMMCCTLPAITKEQYADSELEYPPTDKKFGKECVLLGCDGCTCYSKRPNICRGYMCLYTLGVVEKPPVDSGIAWSIEPNVERENLEWSAIAHCYDADALLSSPEALAEAMLIQDSVLCNLKVACVILRSPNVGIRLEFNKTRVNGKLEFSYSAQRAKLADEGLVDEVLGVENLDLDPKVVVEALNIIYR